MANVGFLTFFIIMASLILVGLLIFVFVKIYGDKDKPKNEDIIINMLSNYTDGYGLLIAKKIESNKEMVKIVGYPRDIDYIEIEDKKVEVKEQILFVRKDLLVPFGNSTHRNIFLALADKPEQLPVMLKGHPFGKKIAEYIDEVNAKKDTLEIKNIRENNLLRIAKKTEALEFVEDLNGIFMDATKDIMKLNNTNREPREMSSRPEPRRYE